MKETIKTKAELKKEIEELKKRQEERPIHFSKKELQAFIKKEVEDNLRVEINESIGSYGSPDTKSIETSWGDTDVYESCSFE